MEKSDIRPTVSSRWRVEQRLAPWLFCLCASFFFFSYACALLQPRGLQALQHGLDCRPSGGQACAHEEGTPPENMVYVTYSTQIHLFVCLFVLRYAGLSLLWPLPLWSTGSGRAGSATMAHGPSRSAACGIFPDLSLIHISEPTRPY